jgi:hypothetical protein
MIVDFGTKLLKKASNSNTTLYRIIKTCYLHFIGIQRAVFCILSEFKYFYYLRLRQKKL